MAEIPLDVRELPGGFFKIEPAVGGLPGEAAAGAGDRDIVVETRLVNIAKCCVVRPVLARASSNEETMLTPSIGFWGMPLTDWGAAT